MTASMSSRSTWTSVESVAVSSTSTDASTSGSSPSVTGSATDLGREIDRARVGAVGHDDLADAGAHRRVPALRDLTGAEHEHRAAAQREHRLLGERDRGRRDGQRLAADRGLRARPLADHERLAEHPGEQLTRRTLLLGELPRVAHLAEDLALADDHGVEARGHTEEVRDRAVVVVRVQVLGEVIGAADACSARNSRMSDTAAWNFVQRA